jgi:transposase
MSGQMTKVFVADARRRWSEEEKQAIIEESKTNPVARVAKKYGVATSLLFRWRKLQGIRVRRPALQLPAEEGFVRVALPACAKPELRFGEGRPAPAAAVPTNHGQGSIEIVLSCGRRVIVGKDVDVSALKRVVEALESR